MKSAYDFRTGGAFSEMAIVDTFTKLIFGEEEEFSSSEELIIQALRLADTSVAPDTRRDLGQYLRALGVAEMIQLVTRVQACLADSMKAVVLTGKAAGHTSPGRIKRARY